MRPASHYRRGATPLLLTLGVLANLPAQGQGLPTNPLVLGDGRMTIGAEVSAAFSCAIGDGVDGGCGDDTGFFNYTDYEHSTLRTARLDITAAFKATSHVSVLADIRTEHGQNTQPYALYARIRPWVRRSFDIQVGRIPPTFGAFARRTYANDNFLIGYPLAYQYLTSLRPDSLPASADELLRMRGRGWLSSFSVGNRTPDRGLPLANVFRWDTGVQVHGATRIIDAAMSVTAGSLGNPRVVDDNSGKQVAGRIALQKAGLVVGGSASRGPYLTRGALVSAAQSDSSRFTQTALGGDVEYSRDYYLVRFETVISDWTLPNIGASSLDRPIRARGMSVEARYKLHPRLYTGARFDHLGFSTITGGTRTEAWDAPVTRMEVGGGYAVQRNLLLKMSVQHNTRDGGRVTRLDLVAAQVLFWF